MKKFINETRIVIDDSKLKIKGPRRVWEVAISLNKRLPSKEYIFCQLTQACMQWGIRYNERFFEGRKWLELENFLKSEETYSLIKSLIHGTRISQDQPYNEVTSEHLAIIYIKYVIWYQLNLNQRDSKVEEILEFLYRNFNF